MRTLQISLIFSLLLGCKSSTSSSESMSSSIASTVKTATITLPRNGASNLIPPLLIEENVTYKIMVLNEDKGPGKVFISTNVDILALKPNTLLNYAPPPGSAMVTINGDGPAQASTWEPGNFSINHGAFYDRSAPIEIVVSNLPPEMIGGSLTVNIHTWPLREDIAKKGGFTFDGSKPFSGTVDVQKYIRDLIIGIRDQEHMTYSLTINHVSEGFTTNTPAEAIPPSNNTTSTPNPLADIRVSYIDNENPPIDMTSKLKFDDNGMSFGLRSTVASLSINVIYSSAANDKKMIEVEYPGGKGGVVTGFTNIDHFAATPDTTKADDR